MSRKRNNKKQLKERLDEQLGEIGQSETLSPQLSGNLHKLQCDLGSSNDLIIRRLEPEAMTLKLAFAFIDGLIDTTTVAEFSIQTVMDEIASIHSSADHELHADDLISIIRQRALAVGDITKTSEWKIIYLHLMSGDTILFIDSSEEAIIASTRGGERRSVSEPSTQTVIRGPREGFTESIRTNTALLRRKIKSPNLWLEEIQLGEVTRTDVGIMYIHGIAGDELVREVKNRLSNIHVDGILESGYIEEWIENTNLTFFPTVYHSERPDVIAANLLEGRIAILVDGTPFVLVVPCTFNMFFQAAEDYYQRFDAGSLVRMLRYLSYMIALMLPSFYVAIISFHQEMIPTLWLLKLAVQREGVPFPAFVEAFIMETIFEILREAGIRMPRSVGNTISIVGGLVIGEAAVQAGIISPAVVIVVSLTAISSYVSPAYSFGIAARTLRFGLLIFASMMGIYGIGCFLLIILLHLCSLKSFGVPYMSPYAPFIPSDMKDSMLRVPFRFMKKRPKLISLNDPTKYEEDTDGTSYTVHSRIESKLTNPQSSEPAKERQAGEDPNTS